MSARRKTEPPTIEVKQLSINEIDLGIKRLRRRIEEVKSLDPQKVSHDDARVSTVETNIREAIREVFGQNSPEFKDHEYHEIWHGGYNMGDNEYDLQRKFAEGIPQTVLMLEGLISRLEEKREDLSDLTQNATISQVTKPSGTTRRIFLVHGHDKEAKQTVARFLEKLELEPVILQERPNEGRTIIEKFGAVRLAHSPQGATG